MKFTSDPRNQTFSTSSGKDVKDTKMLKGEAQNSLSGTNVTKQDSRSGGGGLSSGAGGKPRGN